MPSPRTWPCQHPDVETSRTVRNKSLLFRPTIWAWVLFWGIFLDDRFNFLNKHYCIQAFYTWLSFGNCNTGDSRKRLLLILPYSGSFTCMIFNFCCKLIFRFSSLVGVLSIGNISIGSFINSRSALYFQFGIFHIMWIGFSKVFGSQEWLYHLWSKGDSQILCCCLNSGSGNIFNPHSTIVFKTYA